MIEIKDIMLYFLALFNPNGEEFKKLVINKDAIENPVAENDYYSLNDSNAGAIANTLEYERRLARFLLQMLNFMIAKNMYKDFIADDWMDNARPKNYTDEQYYEYVYNNIFAFKESSYSIITILQPFSSEIVQIFEQGNWIGNMFLKYSYFNYYKLTKTTTNDLVTPAIISGSNSEGSGDFYFKIKIQPKDQTSEILIIKYLKIAHVAGVKYDILYYYKPPWHP